MWEGVEPSLPIFYARLYNIVILRSVCEAEATMLITRYTSVLIKTTENTVVSPTYVPAHRWVDFVFSIVLLRVCLPIAVLYVMLYAIYVRSVNAYYIVHLTFLLQSSYACIQLRSQLQLFKDVVIW